MQRTKIRILTLWQDEIDCNENEVSGQAMY